jgi:hypothetical protein
MVAPRQGSQSAGQFGQFRSTDRGSHTSTEKDGEGLDVSHLIALRLLAEPADGHVLEHAVSAQRSAGGWISDELDTDILKRLAHAPADLYGATQPGPRPPGSARQRQSFPARFV